ncbi:MAG: PH domain-containing protein [Patescibacteria group bacterium]
MQLHQGEAILKVVKRHPTPYVYWLVKISVIAAPLYALIYFIGREAGGEIGLILFVILSFFLGIIITIFSLDYVLDKLVITNKRVVWINWRSPFKKDEHEADFLDIQDIDIQEKGILSKLKMFNYGVIEIETAGTKTCIRFQQCPNAQAVKHFIFQHIEKQRGGIHAKRENPPQDNEWSVN